LKEEAIIVAMSRLLNDDGYRMKLKCLSKPQALKFSWDRCASEVLDIYGEVIKRPKFESLRNNME
jgi:glycosyltransferase involved in cell wall biosynthesis